MSVVAALGGLGATELVLVLVIVLVLFGPGRLPQVFESFGKGMRAFKNAQKDEPIDVAARQIPEGADAAALEAAGLDAAGREIREDGRRS